MEPLACLQTLVPALFLFMDGWMKLQTDHFIDRLFNGHVNGWRTDRHADAYL